MQDYNVIRLNEVIENIRRYKNFRASNLIAIKDNIDNTYIFISHATVIAKADF